MNIFKKIYDKLFPPYKETEQEKKVHAIILDVLEDPMTNKILYDSYCAYFSNTEKNVTIAIEDRKIRITSKDKCYSMDSSAKFSFLVENILKDYVRKAVEDMIQKSEELKNNLLDTMLTDLGDVPRVEYE